MRLAIIFALLGSSAMAQVQQGSPNASFAPAFENQTRAPALAATPVSVARFAEGLERPWGMAALPGGQFVVTERPGRMRIINADGSVRTGRIA